VLLAEYDIVYMTRNVVKESEIADNLTNYAVEDYEPLIELIIYQVKGEWQTKDEKLKFYKDYLSKLANEFEEIKFTHISRDKNQFVDALATVASMTQINIGSKIQPISIEIRNLQAHYCSLDESPNDIKRFIQHREYPLWAFKTDEKTLRRMVMNHYLDVDVLYKRSFDKTLLRCLNEKEVMQALQEI